MCMIFSSQLTVGFKQVTQAKLALVGDMRSPEDLEFMQFGALKMLLLEQVDLWVRGVYSLKQIG